jgi:hypothetical protein
VVAEGVVVHNVWAEDLVVSRLEENDESSAGGVVGGIDDGVGEMLVLLVVEVPVAEEVDAAADAVVAEDGAEAETEVEIELEAVIENDVAVQLQQSLLASYPRPDSSFAGYGGRCEGYVVVVKTDLDSDAVHAGHWKGAFHSL